MDDTIVQVDVLVIPWGLEGMSIPQFVHNIQRDVKLAPLGLALPASRVISTRSRRIVGSPIMPMDRDEEHAGIVGKDTMRSIPLVDIVIQDGHSFQTVFPLGVPGGHCHVVEHAKTIYSVPDPRVMPRRTDESEAILPSTLHHPINTL